MTQTGPQSLAEGDELHHPRGYLLGTLQHSQVPRDRDGGGGHAGGAVSLTLDSGYPLVCICCWREQRERESEEQGKYLSYIPDIQKE